MWIKEIFGVVMRVKYEDDYVVVDVVDKYYVEICEDENEGSNIGVVESCNKLWLLVVYSYVKLWGYLLIIFRFVKCGNLVF